jgi:hypothetical protein
METLETHVPSVASCRELKHAGWTKETSMVWIRMSGENWHLVSNTLTSVTPLEWLYAPLADELLEEIPWPSVQRGPDTCWAVGGVYGTDTITMAGNTLVDALTKLYIELRR